MYLETDPNQYLHVVSKRLQLTNPRQFFYTSLIFSYARISDTEQKNFIFYEIIRGIEKRIVESICEFRFISDGVLSYVRRKIWTQKHVRGKKSNCHTWKNNDKRPYSKFAMLLHAPWAKTHFLGSKRINVRMRILLMIAARVAKCRVPRSKTLCS